MQDLVGYIEGKWLVKTGEVWEVWKERRKPTRCKKPKSRSNGGVQSSEGGTHQNGSEWMMEVELCVFGPQRSVFVTLFSHCNCHWTTATRLSVKAWSASFLKQHEVVYASQAAYYVASISDTKVHALSLTCSLSFPYHFPCHGVQVWWVHEYVGKRRERGKRSSRTKAKTNRYHRFWPSVGVFWVWPSTCDMW